MADITLRNTSFWKSDTPLMSERVRIILSNPKDAAKLVQAIRNSRSGKDSSFTVSEETKEKLEEAASEKI